MMSDSVHHLYMLKVQSSPLARKLADRDDRQLLDMGLIRAADGSLRRADDPTLLAVPEKRPLQATFGMLARVWNFLRALPLQSHGTVPSFVHRE